MLDNAPNSHIGLDNHGPKSFPLRVKQSIDPWIFMR